jgi:hypothetical protein
MTTNTIVLIVVTIFVAIALAAIVAVLARKLRAERRLLGGAGILDEAEAGARLIQAEAAAKAKATQLEGGIRALRERTKRKPSYDSRVAADMRAQLTDDD